MTTQFPKGEPRIAEPSWFSESGVHDLEREVEALEAAHKARVDKILNKDRDLPVIGQKCDPQQQCGHMQEEPSEVVGDSEESEEEGTNDMQDASQEMDGSAELDLNESSMTGDNRSWLM